MSESIGPKQPEGIELSADATRKYRAEDRAEDRIGPADLARLRSKIQSDRPSLREMRSQIEHLQVSRGSSATSEQVSPPRAIRWRSAAIDIDAAAIRVFTKGTLPPS